LTRSALLRAVAGRDHVGADRLNRFYRSCRYHLPRRAGGVDFDFFSGTSCAVQPLLMVLPVSELKGAN
jgi:hypothetical protein